MMGVLCHPLRYACHPIPLKGLITKFTNSLTDKQYNYIRLSPNGINYLRGWHRCRSNKGTPASSRCAGRTDASLMSPGSLLKCGFLLGFCFIFETYYIVANYACLLYVPVRLPCTVMTTTIKCSAQCVWPPPFSCKYWVAVPSNLLINTTIHNGHDNSKRTNSTHLPLAKTGYTGLHSSLEGDTRTAQDEQRQHSVPRIKTCSLYLRAQKQQRCLHLQSGECIHFQDDEYLVRTYTGKSIMPKNET